VEELPAKLTPLGDAIAALTEEVKGYSGVFDAAISDDSPANQLALTNYHRKAEQDIPKFKKYVEFLVKYAHAT